MADGSDGTDVSPESEATAVAAAEKGGEIWGTLEELLLACAVTRHGTASWDSVATEVQTRSPLAARPGLTPHSCRLRFRHLHRRFSTAGSGGEEDEVEEDPAASAAEGWVDELRRLRVAELRRDVERCDLSIGTLQSKVKRLREERERSVSGEAKPDEASGNDRLSGEEPGRSCRESNSTDLKPPKHPGHQGGGAKEEEVAKQEASGESAAASKESSDVRSSASLCRRRRRRGTGSGKADEEEEAASAPPRTSRPFPSACRAPRRGRGEARLRAAAATRARRRGGRRIPGHDQAPRGPGDRAAQAGHVGWLARRRRRPLPGTRALPRPAAALHERRGLLPAQHPAARRGGRGSRARHRARVGGAPRAETGARGRASTSAGASGHGHRRVADREAGEAPHRVPQAELHHEGVEEGGDRGEGRGRGGGGRRERRREEGRGDQG